MKPTSIRVFRALKVSTFALLAGCAAGPVDPGEVEDFGTEEDGVASCPSDVIVGEGQPLASMGSCGKLVYRTYANRGQSNADNRLPDFSYAGYRGGGVAIPDVPVVETVEPASGDDRARIQAAIDKVAQKPLNDKGLRGAVLLKKGQYQVSDTLHIKASGVVLRGEGQGDSGTVILATAAKQYTVVDVQGSGSGLGEVSGTRTRITTPFVPVGSRTFEVDSAEDFAPGDTIVVLRTPNDAWIDALGMGKFGWDAGSYASEHPRKITAVSKDKITVDIPIIDTMEKKYGGGYIYKSKVEGRIRNVGVEDIRFDSKYSGATDEKHGWTAVRLARATSSWVRRITAVHIGYSAVTIDDESAYNTVEDSAHVDPVSKVEGGRRYSFYVQSGTGNLFQRNFTRSSRHSFVTGSKVNGPNVWLDCLAVDTHSDDGPHHRWATGLLFDNTRGDELKVQNRKDSGSGHGWAGAQVLFWNARAETLVCDAPRGAMNWAIGCTGDKSDGDWAPEEPFGLWSSLDKPVTPRSLYLQQLKDRRGVAAVDAITLPKQREGRIWKELSTWAGEGRLSNLLK
jgi:hypothetical protein